LEMVVRLFRPSDLPTKGLLDNEMVSVMVMLYKSIKCITVLAQLAAVESLLIAITITLIAIIGLDVANAIKILTICTTNVESHAENVN